MNTQIHTKFGSFVCTDVNGDIYSFVGLSTDIDKLPADDSSIGSGSTAFCADTGAALMYEKSSGTWYEL